MIKLTLGAIVGATLAMMFPEQASALYEMVRGTINQGATAAVEATS